MNAWTPDWKSILMRRLRFSLEALSSRSLVITGVALALLSVLSGCERSDTVEQTATSVQVMSEPAGEWFTGGGDETQAHYSPLTGINRVNVSQLV